MIIVTTYLNTKRENRYRTFEDQCQCKLPQCSFYSISKRSTFKFSGYVCQAAIVITKVKYMQSYVETKRNVRLCTHIHMR